MDGFDQKGHEKEKRGAKEKLMRGGGDGEKEMERQRGRKRQKEERKRG